MFGDTESGIKSFPSAITPGISSAPESGRFSCPSSGAVSGISSTSPGCSGIGSVCISSDLEVFSEEVSPDTLPEISSETTAAIAV